jgi:hypothetical protein
MTLMPENSLETIKGLERLAAWHHGAQLIVFH